MKTRQILPGPTLGQALSWLRGRKVDSNRRKVDSNRVGLYPSGSDGLSINLTHTLTRITENKEGRQEAKSREWGQW